MADEYQVLDCLREEFARVNAKRDTVVDSFLDLSRCVTSFGSQVALLHGDFANQSSRIDRIELRLERIERRLEFVDSPPT